MLNKKLKYAFFLICILSVTSYVQLENSTAGPIPPESPLVVGTMYWTTQKITYKQNTWRGYVTRFFIEYDLTVICRENSNGKYLEVWRIGADTRAYVRPSAGVSLTTSGYYYVAREPVLASHVVQIYGTPTIICEGKTFNPEFIIQMDIMGLHAVDASAGTLPPGWREEFGPIVTEKLYVGLGKALFILPPWTWKSY